MSCRPTRTMACPVQGPSAAGQAWVRGTRRKAEVANRKAGSRLPWVGARAEASAALKAKALAWEPP